MQNDDDDLGRQAVNVHVSSHKSVLGIDLLGCSQEKYVGGCQWLGAVGEREAGLGELAVGWAGF